MSETIEKRLSDLGVTIPAAAAPAANYVPYCRTGNLLFTAGQLPLKDGKLQASGLLGRDVDTAAGKEGAKYGLTYWNKTVKVYHNVSQFWTYDEKKFLQQPVYSRDYPPLKS